MSVEKYGRPGAGTEDDDAALLEVPLGTQRDVRLGHLRHRDRRLHAHLRARLLEEVLQRERVHHGAEHAHVVGAAAVHAALAELRAAEEVAAADDDGDLDAVRIVRVLRRRLGDLACAIAADDVGVHPERSAAERLARQFEQDAASAIGHGSPPAAGVGGGSVQANGRLSAAKGSWMRVSARLRCQSSRRATGSKACSCGWASCCRS